MSDWRPRLRFSRTHLSEMAGFGLSVMGGRILYYANRWFDQLLIGRILGTISLGLYFNARRLQNLATGLLIGTFSGVSMPALARLQGDLPRFRNSFAEICRFVGLVAFPAFAGLSMMAHDTIVVVLGERWIGSAPVLQVLALAGVIHTIQYVNGAAMMALGRADLRLRLHSLLAIVNIVAYLMTVKHGIVAVASAYTTVSYLWAPVDTLVNRRLGAVSLRQLLRAVYAQVLATVIMVAAILILRDRALVEVQPSLRLVICVVAGAGVYAAAAALLDRRLWPETLDLIRHLRHTPPAKPREGKS
jgi:PST family polysaccharide transporter